MSIADTVLTTVVQQKKNLHVYSAHIPLSGGDLLRDACMR